MSRFNAPAQNRVGFAVFPFLMCRLLFLIGGLGLVATLVRAQPDGLDRRFATANEAYVEGRYEQAVEGYRSILDTGYESVALYHNLGNAYVRLNQVGRAIWAYERGQRLRPDDPRLRHNLEYVRRREGLPAGGLPPRGPASLVAGWSPFLLFGLGWGMLVAGLVVAVFGDELNQNLNRRSPVAGGSVIAGLLLVVIAGGTSYVQAHDHRAVVISERTFLRRAPGGETATDTTVRVGAMLEVEARRDGWVRVRLRDQSAGWMPERTLKEI